MTALELLAVRGAIPVGELDDCSREALALHQASDGRGRLWKIRGPAFRGKVLTAIPERGRKSRGGYDYHVVYEHPDHGIMDPYHGPVPVGPDRYWLEVDEAMGPSWRPPSELSVEACRALDPDR